jgi:hypothetical protein
MNKYVKYSLVVVGSIIGIVVYYFVTKSGNTVFSAANEVTYTCPMPQDSFLVRNQEIVLNAE